MAFAALASIPCSFESGTSVTVTMTLPDVLPSEGNATLYLSLNGAAVTNIAATESGVYFTFTITAAASAALAPGLYDYLIRFTYTAGEVVPQGSGQINALPNLAASQTPSFAQAQVTLLEGAIAALNATDKQSVSFNGQSFTRAAIGQYRAEWTFWKSQLLKEQRAARGQNVLRSIAPVFASDRGASTFCGCR